MGILRSDSDWVCHFVMQLVDVFIEELRVQHAMTPIKSKILAH